MMPEPAAHAAVGIHAGSGDVERARPAAHLAEDKVKDKRTMPRM